ncbi:MAG: hypothetical protein M0021_15950 [Clostridia bacterium]|nr:hypothetical protein [Clostridia bacterium]
MSLDERDIKIQELEKRIIELETKQKLMLDSILSLIDLINPNYDSFSLFLLTNGFTAKEIENLENLLSTLAFNKGFHNISISKEEFIKKFEEILPRKKDMLLGLIKALKAEDRHPHICSLVLDGKEAKSE